MTLTGKVGQVNQRMYGGRVRTHLIGPPADRGVPYRGGAYDGTGALHGLRRADPWSGVTAATGIGAADGARVSDAARRHVEDLDLPARSPFRALSTSDAAGSCDVSPRGDGPGFTLVLDAGTLALPDRPGNRRCDSFHNVLSNPHVGLLYLIPGVMDVPRVNGRARLLTDAPPFDAMPPA